MTDPRTTRDASGETAFERAIGRSRTRLRAIGEFLDLHPRLATLLWSSPVLIVMAAGLLCQYGLIDRAVFDGVAIVLLVAVIAVVAALPLAALLFAAVLLILLLGTVARAVVRPSILEAAPPSDARPRRDPDLPEVIRQFVADFALPFTAVRRCWGSKPLVLLLLVGVLLGLLGRAAGVGLGEPPRDVWWASVAIIACTVLLTILLNVLGLAIALIGGIVLFYNKKARDAHEHLLRRCVPSGCLVGEYALRSAFYLPALVVWLVLTPALCTFLVFEGVWGVVAAIGIPVGILFVHLLMCLNPGPLAM
jgi:hypothetical protein